MVVALNVVLTQSFVSSIISLDELVGIQLNLQSKCDCSFFHTYVINIVCGTRGPLSLSFENSFKQY